jgi:hypothetical protein
MWEPRRLTTYGSSQPVTMIAIHFFLLSASLCLIIWEKSWDTSLTVSCPESRFKPGSFKNYKREFSVIEWYSVVCFVHKLNLLAPQDCCSSELASGTANLLDVVRPPSIRHAPFTRPLLVQDSINTERTQTYIRAFVGCRIQGEEALSHVATDWK